MYKKILFLLAVIVLSFSVFFAVNDFISNKNKFLASVSDTNKIWQAQKINEEKLKEKIGQMLITGFRGLDVSEDSEINKIIGEVNIGGVILFDYDVPSGSEQRNIKNSEQVKKLIADLQKYSKTPLFISVDAEGGSVNRLKEKLGFLDIASAEEMSEKNITDAESKKLSQQLSELGFNMNLAPVVDLNINPKNPIIGKLGRSFSADPEEVVKNAEIFINNHKEKGIICVEKHFPGQGNAKVDTHIGLADVTDTFKEEELIPYEDLNKKSLLDVVMVAHTINKNIDEKYPATMSKNFITGILKNQIGFNGVVMSDDMQMDAIANNFSLSEAVIEAINAGTDIIVVSNNTKQGYDPDISYKVRDIILNAVDSGKISQERIEEVYNKIINLKNKFNIIESGQGL